MRCVSNTDLDSTIAWWTPVKRRRWRDWKETTNLLQIRIIGNRQICSIGGHAIVHWEVRFSRWSLCAIIRCMWILFVDAYLRFKCGCNGTSAIAILQRSSCGCFVSNRWFQIGCHVHGRWWYTIKWLTIHESRWACRRWISPSFIVYSWAENLNGRKRIR